MGNVKTQFLLFPRNFKLFSEWYEDNSWVFTNINNESDLTNAVNNLFSDKSDIISQTNVEEMGLSVSILVFKDFIQVIGDLDIEDIKDDFSPVKIDEIGGVVYVYNEV